MTAQSSTLATYSQYTDVFQVTEDGMVKCPDCDQTFKNNHYMQMHHKFKHGEDISCPKCNYVAKSRLMLK